MKKETTVYQAGITSATLDYYVVGLNITLERPKAFYECSFSSMIVRSSISENEVMNSFPVSEGDTKNTVKVFTNLAAAQAFANLQEIESDEIEDQKWSAPAIFKVTVTGGLPISMQTKETRGFSHHWKKATISSFECNRSDIVSIKIAEFKVGSSVINITTEQESSSICSIS